MPSSERLPFSEGGNRRKDGIVFALTKAPHPCAACEGRGGFNRFATVQGLGTTTTTSHQWIPCSHCAGTGVEPDKGGTRFEEAK